MNSIFFCLTYFLLGVPIFSYSQLSKDSVFVSWNKSTFRSVDEQANSTKGSIISSYYENRAESLKALFEISSANSINKNSIRYHFLNVVNNSPIALKKFYIIEANQSGGKVLFRNFLILQDSMDNKVQVGEFYYINGEWKNRGWHKMKLNIDNDLQNYIVPYATGGNNDDVIVTHFFNNSVIQSVYYLYATLARNSDINRIFLVDGKQLK